MTDAIDLYLKGNEASVSGDILSRAKISSNEVSLTKVTVNGSSNGILNLSYPKRQIDIEIEGELLNDIPMAIEARLYDRENILLAKYAPILMKTEVPKFKRGRFSISESIHLPGNMSNGEYNLQIELTYPNVQYLAVIPNAVKLVLSDFISPTGNPLMYKQNGLLLLQ